MRGRIKDSSLLAGLLEADAWLADSIVARKETLGVQIIYTQIDRKGKDPVFTDHYYQVDASRYFYPASTVKFPVAALALQRLRELKEKNIDKYTTMITAVADTSQLPAVEDSSSKNGKPSIAQYIRKIFLVSDNDAFNRLYEFLGQEYINEQLHQMGYNDAQIIHRLAIVLNEEQNRHVNPVQFVDSTGAVLYQQTDRHSHWPYKTRPVLLGEGYQKGDTLVKEPFDFTYKNRLSLVDLHTILRSVIFPESLPSRQRFNLGADDYDFLRKYMSMYPRESDYPYYDPVAYPDTYVKKFMYGNENLKPDPSIRIYNKSGTAYGFLTDAAYIVDTSHQIEFLLSATIYCNSDGIFNDDRYDYDTIGYPFFKRLGQVVYEYERGRR